MASDDVMQRILNTVLRLEDGQISIRAELGALPAELGNLVVRVDRLEEGQTNLHADLASLRTEFLAELGQTRAAITDRFDRLENRVTEMRDDIEVAMGSTEAVQRVNDTTRADLRTLGEQVSIMWKQIKRLEGRVRGITGEP